MTREHIPYKHLGLPWRQGTGAISHCLYTESGTFPLMELRGSDMTKQEVADFVRLACNGYEQREAENKRLRELNAELSGLLSCCKAVLKEGGDPDNYTLYTRCTAALAVKEQKDD